MGGNEHPGEGESAPGALDPIAEAQERIDGATLTIRYILDVADSFETLNRMRADGAGMPGGAADPYAAADNIYAFDIEAGEVVGMVYAEFLTGEELGVVRRATATEIAEARQRATQSTEATNPLLPPCPALA